MLNVERLISVLFEAICSENIPSFVLIILKTLSKQENCWNKKKTKWKLVCVSMKINKTNVKKCSFCIILTLCYRDKMDEAYHYP